MDPTLGPVSVQNKRVDIYFTQARCICKTLSDYNKLVEDV